MIRRSSQRLMMLVVLVGLLPGAPALALPPSVADGLAWLEANQNPDGSWGAASELTVTGTTLETLTALDPCTAAVSGGATWLAGQGAANHEFLARQTAGLAGEPESVEDARLLALDLLSRRNPPETDAGLPNWPEGGWGIAPGFETDSLTTALAMLALDRTGFNGGFSVTDDTVAGGATNVYEWFIPGNALKARIQITVAGATVRLRMTQGSPPTPFDPYFELPPGGPYLIVFPDSGLPFTPGTNYVAIENPDGLAPTATYSMTASYETPDFDTRSLAEPLEYLRQAQNPDGGWGSQRGVASEFYTTLHVLLALFPYTSYELDTEIASAIAHVKGQQLPDGSFGFDGSTVSYVTALATLALVRDETPTFGVETGDAVAALNALQDVDGSWDQSAYDTALAMLALWEHEVPPVAEAGPAQTVSDVDENCIENVTLSGSATDGNGSVVSYAWSDDCVQIATGSSAAVSLGVGTHEIVLTVTDDAGNTAVDIVTITVDGTIDHGCADTDADGVLDDGDGSGTVGDNQCASGVRQVCDDNCPLDSNPDQADGDGDLFGDVCDCDPGDGQIWSRPGEVSLSLTHDGITGQTDISWAAPAETGGIAALFYDTLRADDPADFTVATCLETDDADTLAADTATPAAGAAFYYLVRAENGCPGGGTLGAGSNGIERAGAACP